MLSNADPIRSLVVLCACIAVSRADERPVVVHYNWNSTTLTKERTLPVTLQVQTDGTLLTTEGEMIRKSESLSGVLAPDKDGQPKVIVLQILKPTTTTIAAVDAAIERLVRDLPKGARLVVHVSPVRTSKD